MNELDSIRLRFRYGAVALCEVFASLDSISAVPPAVLRVLSHCIAAEVLWLARLRQVKPSFAVWPELDLETCKTHATELEREWTAYLDALDEATLDGTITYVNSKGETFTSRRRDVIEHVCLHGVHHRGQIAQTLRAAGHEPPYLDLIHFARSGRLG